MPICPDEPRLRDYVTGRLTRDDHGTVEVHVEECSACRATVARIDDSTVLPSLRAAAEAPAPDEELSVLIDLAKRAGMHGPTDVGHEQDTVLAPGTSLGQYIVEALVGAGGMGQVYRARHVHMKRTVAIKVVAPHRLRSRPARERFRREIEAAARVLHPNVVHALDAGEVDGRSYLVMEFVDGRNLDQVVETEGRLSVDMAIDVVRQAARGLRAAHAAGIVHRDVKPSNLVRTPDGVVKLFDLGIARALEGDSDASGLTSSETILGSVAYLAPEQATNAKQAAEPADVYSLGATFFTLLTGRPVFETSTAVEAIVAHRERPAPSVRKLRPDCPEWIDDLIGQMLAKAPDERPELDEVGTAFEQGNTQPIASRTHASGRVPLVPLLAIATVLLILATPFVYQAAFGPSSNTGEETPRGSEVVDDGHAPEPPKPPAKPLLELVSIPVGTPFSMGASEGDDNARSDERPAHEVRLTQPFRMGAFEVTNAQWRAVMGDEAGRDDPMSTEDDDRPVAGVSWREAVLFCNRLSEREGLPAFYEITDETVVIRGGLGYRLPTEAEWEYACRAGSTTRWSFGDDPAELGEHAWFAENAVGQLQPVGRLKPNAWGLHDMHGNAPEWCWDRYSPRYYANSEPINPPGPTTGGERVFRGGSATDTAASTRSSARRPLAFRYGGFSNPIGFRVARNVK